MGTLTCACACSCFVLAFTLPRDLRRQRVKIKLLRPHYPAGMAADSCVAATCFDAHSLEYEAVIVSEAVAGVGDRKQRVLNVLADAEAVQVIDMQGFSTWLPDAEDAVEKA